MRASHSARRYAGVEDDAALDADDEAAFASAKRVVVLCDLASGRLGWFAS